jgi:hypothetical protein
VIRGGAPSTARSILTLLLLLLQGLGKLQLLQLVRV